MAMNIHRVLWPTDFSELSLCGGKYAKAMCDQFGAALHILHVIPPMLGPDIPATIPPEMPPMVNDPKLLDDANGQLQRMAASHFHGLPVTTESLFGNPWHEICEYAEKNEIDLIIVATHGRTGFMHAIIGSTAERVVQHAKCPVLTVKNKGRVVCSD
ncbi:MAG: universal stress protein [Phycisphaerae bacterium]